MREEEEGVCATNWWVGDVGAGPRLGQGLGVVGKYTESPPCCPTATTVEVGDRGMAQAGAS